MNVATANKLVQLRKEKGFSQEELAEKLGISRQAVSKWERAEAAPDTDNLVTLAKLYGISLDELLGNELDQSEEERAFSKEDDVTKVNIGIKGIHVEDGEDYVHVGWDGVHVHDRSGHRVDVKDGKAIVNGEEYDYKNEMKKRWYVFPFPFLVTLVYVVMGVAWNMWHPYWLIFLTIPLYYSLVSAIEHRRFDHFAYPVLAALIYLWFGFTAGAWHPNWIIFLTVPLYYMIFPGSKNHDYNKKDYKYSYKYDYKNTENGSTECSCESSECSDRDTANK